MEWQVYCGLLISSRLFDLLSMCFLAVIGLSLMIYSLFFENPEKPCKYWTELMIGGIILVIAGIRIGILTALIGFS